MVGAKPTGSHEKFSTAGALWNSGRPVHVSCSSQDGPPFLRPSRPNQIFLICLARQRGCAAVPREYKPIRNRAAPWRSPPPVHCSPIETVSTHHKCKAEESHACDLPFREFAQHSDCNGRRVAASRSPRRSGASRPGAVASVWPSRAEGLARVPPLVDRGTAHTTRSPCANRCMFAADQVSGR